METIALMNTPVSLKRKKQGKYVVKKTDTSKILTWGVLTVFALSFLYFMFFVCDYKWDQVRPEMIVKYVTAFVDFSTIRAATISDVFASLINTIILAIVTTIIGVIIGLFLGLLAARNLCNPIVSNIVRGIAGLIRAVPTIIWVLIFISGFGLTATTAIVGMSFHSVAYFIKSYSEAFEEVDKGAMEAMKATGAGWWQIVFNAVLPVSFTKMVSWIAMRCEMNFAAAVIIGPAVGVPGTIGSILNSYQRAGGYGTVGLCVLVIFATALLFEIFITLYKQKSIVTE